MEVGRVLVLTEVNHVLQLPLRVLSVLKHVLVGRCIAGQVEVEVSEGVGGLPAFPHLGHFLELRLLRLDSSSNVSLLFIEFHISILLYEVVVCCEDSFLVSAQVTLLVLLTVSDCLCELVLPSSQVSFIEGRWLQIHGV